MTWNPTKIVLDCIVVAVRCGITHDQITARISFTTDRLLSGEDSAADKSKVSLRIQALRNQRRATPAGRGTQLHREDAPETVRVRVRYLRELQATFQPRSAGTAARELTR